MLQTIMFIGPQGSGKGTQARLLKDYFEKKDRDTPVFYFGTGDGFREFSGEDGLTQSLVREKIAGGNILPTFLPVWLWTKGFIENLEGNEHIILDGAPRTLEEMKNLESALRFYSRENPMIIEFTLDEAAALERMNARAREDDTKDAIEKRLAFFRDRTLPIIDYAKQNPFYRVRSVDASGTPEEIHAEVVNVIAE